MLNWFTANWGTLLVGAIVLLLVIAIFVSLRKQKKSGGCSGGCSGCASCGGCRSAQAEKPTPKHS